MKSSGGFHAGAAKDPETRERGETASTFNLEKRMNTKSTKADTSKQFRNPTLLAASLCCALMLGLTHANPAAATQGQGVTAEPLAVGGLSAPIRFKTKSEGAGGFGDGVAVADVVTVQFTIEPGGYFGWHRHGGP